MVIPEMGRPSEPLPMRVAAAATAVNRQEPTVTSVLAPSSVAGELVF